MLRLLTVANARRYWPHNSSIERFYASRLSVASSWYPLAEGIRCFTEYIDNTTLPQTFGSDTSLAGNLQKFSLSTEFIILVELLVAKIL